MKSKILRKITVGALTLALAIPFTLAACTPEEIPDEGKTDDMYGNLDDFFNDFFDDWNSGSQLDKEPTDWTETYGETGKKETYINGTSTGEFDPSQGTYFYEAEWASYSGKVKANYGEGASGGVQLEYLDAGTWVSLDIYAAKDCTALLGLSLGCASNRYTADLFSISYTDESGENGGLIDTDEYTVTGKGWLAFEEQNIGEVPLKEGKNTLVINSFGGFNLDYFVLTPRLADVTGKKPDSFEFTAKERWAEVFGSYDRTEYLRAERIAEGFDPTWGAYKYEAEAAKIFGGAQVNTGSKASNGATVKTTSEAYIDFVVNSRSECEVLVNAAVTTGAGYSGKTVDQLMKAGIIGGDQATGATENITGTNGFNSVSVESPLGVLRLKKGRNILRIQPLVLSNNAEGGFELDYLALLPVKANIVGNPDYDPNAGYVVPFNEWGTVYGKYAKADYVSGKDNAFDPASGAHIYEAEDAKLGSGLTVEYNKKNASGNKQVSGYGAEHRILTFEIDSTCEYTALISLGYTSAPGFAQYLCADSFMEITYGDGKEVKCSDSRITAADWTGDSTYTESYIGEITLSEGKNTVVLDCFNMAFPNTICLDYLLLSPKQSDSGAEPVKYYTVEYDVNGGTGNIDTESRYEGELFDIASGDGLTKNGYNFGGWRYNGIVYEGGAKFPMPADNITFTAVWLADPLSEWQTVYGTYNKENYVSGKNNYFVPARGAYIYEAEDATLGSGLAQEEKAGASGGKVVSGFSAARRTLTFEVYSAYEYTALLSFGYTSGVDFGSAGFADHYMDITCGSQNVECGSVTLKAGDWTAKPTNVFVENYIGEVNLQKGLNIITVNCKNMAFPDCMALDYILLLPKQADADGESMQYTLTYDLDGGSGTVTSAQYYEGEYITLPTKDEVSFTGHYLEGWTCDGTDYAIGETFIMPNKDVTVKAKWAVSSELTVSFDYGEGDIRNNTCISGNVITLLDGKDVSKTGCKFCGWLKGEVYYAPESEFTVPSANVSFTALWLADDTQWDTVYGQADAGKYYNRVAADNKTFAYNPAIGTHLYEAEQSEFATPLNVESNGKPNASGKAQLAGFTTDPRTFSFTVNAAESGTALLTLCYTGHPKTDMTKPASYYMQITNGGFDMDLTGVTLTVADWTGNGIYVECRVGAVYLQKGENRLSFTLKNFTWNNTVTNGIAMDYILLTPEAVAVAPKHGVTFTLDDDVTGSVTGVAQSYTEGAKFNLPSADGLTRRGYKFDCWNDGTADYAEGAEYTMLQADVIFTAKWIKLHECESVCPVCRKCTNDACEEAVCADKCPRHFTVTFVLGEGVTGTITGFDEPFDNGAVFNLPSADGLTKEGCAFDCWNDGEKDYSEGITYTITKDTVFTAKWTHAWDKLYGKSSAQYTDAQTFTGSYISGKGVYFNPLRGEFIYEGEDANRGSLSLDSSKSGASGGTVLNGFDNNMHTVTFEVYSTREYKALLSLAYTGAPGFGVVHTNADYYFTVRNRTNGTQVNCADTVLNAPDWWASPALFVENVVGEVTLVQGKNVIAVDVAKTAWNNDRSLNECIQIDYMLLSPQKADIIENIAPYTVTYDVNGGAGSIDSATIYQEDIILVTIPENVTYEGYLFMGWSFGGVTYKIGEQFVMPAYDVTLTAVWQQDPFLAWEQTYGTYEREAYISGKDNYFVPARGAYVYEGEDAILGAGLSLENKAAASGGKVVNGFDTAVRTVTFEVYSAYEYTALMSFGYTSGVDFGKANYADHYFKISYGDGKSVICSATVLKAGNWTSDPNVFVENYVGEITLAAGKNTITIDFFNMTFPAGFQLDYMVLTPKKADVDGSVSKYTVAFELGGGTDPNGTIASADYFEGAIFALPDGKHFVKDGYFFDGWLCDSAEYGVGDKYVMPAKNVTFTVKWTASPSHTVTYNLDGGTCAEDINTTKMEGQTMLLPAADGITREGYSLRYWEYGGVLYKCGESEFTMPATDVTFNAVWEAGSTVWETVYGSAEAYENYTKVENASTVNTANEELEFAFDAQNGTLIYEAEAAKRISNGLNIESNKTNASGKAQLAGFNTDTKSFSFKINAAQSGLVLLAIGYTGNSGTNWEAPASDYMSVKNVVNGFELDCSKVKLNNQANWSTNTYVECIIGVIYLDEGVNTIVFSMQLTWPNAVAMDYILLTPEKATPAAADENEPLPASATQTAYVKKRESAL